MDARRALAWTTFVLLSVACSDDDEGKTESPMETADASVSSDKPASQKDASSETPKVDDLDNKAGAPAPSTSSATDYAKAENWLCRPGHNDACEVDLDTTIVKADGSLEVEKFKANPDAEIDCFYVYPTVSLGATPNSDLNPGPEEKSVVRAQFARFASQCRLFAPMYRQVSLTALRASLSGMTSTADRTLGYSDVLASWKYYLEHDNQGRGVVLVGHSQGSSVLTQLLKDQLDKDPVDKRIIAALLAGTNVGVPKDKTKGGTFKNIPVCTSDNELGCVIVFASFRDNTPPSESALFSNSMDASLVAACTNPAALGGGSADLHSYLSTMGPGTSSNPMGPWVTPEKKIDTPFVSTPGLLSAECKFARTGSYLAITVHGEPSDPRTDEITGDVVTNGMVNADWGLHLIDIHMTMGNLLDLVHTKAGKYLAH